MARRGPSGRCGAAVTRLALGAAALLGLGVLLAWVGTGGVLRPIAPQALAPRLHPRDPARAAVTFVVLGDMGTGSLVQSHVAHAMLRVCQQEGCDFVLGVGDNIYPHGVDAVDDAQFQAKFEQPYARFRGIDFETVA